MLETVFKWKQLPVPNLCSWNQNAWFWTLAKYQCIGTYLSSEISYSKHGNRECVVVCVSVHCPSMEPSPYRVCVLSISTVLWLATMIWGSDGHSWKSRSFSLVVQGPVHTLSCIYRIVHLLWTFLGLNWYQGWMTSKNNLPSEISYKISKTKFLSLFWSNVI